MGEIPPSHHQCTGPSSSRPSKERKERGRFKDHRVHTYAPTTPHTHATLVVSKANFYISPLIFWMEAGWLIHGAPAEIMVISPHATTTAPTWG